VSEQELVVLAREGDSKAIKILHQKSYGMVRNSVVHCLQSISDRALEESDFISASLRYTWYTAINLKPGIKFSTLYFRCMQNFIRNKITLSKRYEGHSRYNKIKNNVPETVWITYGNKDDLDYYPDMFGNPPEDYAAEIDRKDFFNSLEPEQKAFVNLIVAGFSQIEIEEIYR
jgi:hypothetical protein